MIGDWLHLSTDTRSVDLFCLFDGLTSTQNSDDRTQGVAVRYTRNESVSVGEGCKSFPTFKPGHVKSSDSNEVFFTLL